MRLIGYVTSGYPNIEGSSLLADQYLAGGCNMLEISLPLLENTEAPYLNDLMVQAYNACPDYDKHLQAIEKITEKHPGVPITILLYDAVAMRIGPEKFAQFCHNCGIQDVNSPDLSTPDVLAALEKYGIHLAGLIRASFTDADIAQAKRTKGFVYMTAFAPKDKCRPGYETIAERIACVRACGVTGQLYCGGGVRKPEDAAVVKAAGADGVFLGTSILKLQGQPGLVAAVRQFREAIGEN